MALNFEDDITARIARQRKQQMAATMGKTVQQMEEDSEHFNEIKEIDTQEIAENEASVSDGEVVRSFRPLLSEEEPPSEEEPLTEEQKRIRRMKKAAELEGMLQAKNLKSGLPSGKLEAIQEQKNLEEEAAASESNRMMDQEYNKEFSKVGGKALGVSKDDYVGEYLAGGRVGPDGKRVGPGHVMHKPFKGSPISEEYLAKSPAEDVAGENKMVQAEKGFMPPQSDETMAVTGERDEDDPKVVQMKKLQDNDKDR